MATRDIVPNGPNEGSLGTDALRWAGGHFQTLKKAGQDVSVEGHTHNSDQITDFTSAVQALIGSTGDALLLSGGTLNPGAEIAFSNGSKLKQGTTDAGLGGNGGIALKCSVDYELKWDAGRLFVMEQNGFSIRSVLFCGSAGPTADDDSTKGFFEDSLWVLDNGTTYKCVDASEGAANWQKESFNVHPDALLGTRYKGDYDNGADYDPGDVVSYNDVLYVRIGEPNPGYPPGTAYWEVWTLSASDLGLSNVENTSDLDKPISNATQNALDDKADSDHGHAVLSGVQEITLNSENDPSLLTYRIASDYFGQGTNDFGIGIVGASNPNITFYPGGVTLLNPVVAGTGQAFATLDTSGKVPAAQLPSYVDDVIEVANEAARPNPGETGKIYVTLNNNKCWRWSGSTYIEVSPLPDSATFTGLEISNSANGLILKAPNNSRFRLTVDNDGVLTTTPV